MLQKLKAISHPFPLMLPCGIRKTTMLPEVQRLQSFPGGMPHVGADGGVPGANHETNKGPRVPKAPKVKTISRQVTGCLTQCSAKMTEIISWQSKLTENKCGLTLAHKNWQVYLLLWDDHS